MDGKKTETKMSFEQGLARLEEIVALLERGEAPLDESLLATRSTRLFKNCSVCVVSFMLPGRT